MALTSLTSRERRVQVMSTPTALAQILDHRLLGARYQEMSIFYELNIAYEG